MGSNKSHGRKSDKETQSPMLKIFKDMMQTEKNDPEKTNLLKGNHEDRMRKHYSGSRTKLGRICASSSSDRLRNARRDAEFNKTSQEVRNTEYDLRRTQTSGDKKDSWWFWAAHADDKKPDDDETCSCVSCALKKLINTEYACIGCLVLIFVITVVFAFLLVFRNVPPLKCGDKEKHVHKAVFDSERLKRKIDSLNGKTWDSNYVGKMNFDGETDWDGSVSRYSTDIGRSRIGDMNRFKEYDAGPSELSSLFDTEKINEIQSNDHLREFYKKLIQTDAQIRKLKSSFNHYTTIDTFQDVIKTPDRFKRSLELLPGKFTHNKRKSDYTSVEIKPRKPFHLFHSPITVQKYKNKTKMPVRPKRKDNATEPMGFVIEKKKIFVQYQPNVASKKVPKCSHAPKESKSHEKQLKHPFYKNTQRLDELLDQFIDKNLHEIMSEPFGVENLFNNEKNKCKHPNPHNHHGVFVKGDALKQIPYVVFDKDNLHKTNGVQNEKKVLKTESTTAVERVLFSRDFDVENPIDKTTATNSYDRLTSVSTIVNPDPMMSTSNPQDLMIRVPNLRKLMQIEGEDENLGYQNTKDVLAEDAEVHGEADGQLIRNKRLDDTYSNTQQNAIKYNPLGVHNPNWKGPMPLYPDELNAMIKQAAMSVNRDQVPVNTKDISPELDNFESDLSDVEYVEDYLTNKYDKLARMAQAYSDYGVLVGKKETANDKKTSSNNLDYRAKLSPGKGLFEKMFRRPKKGSESSEGLRVEVRPTTSSRDDTPLDIYSELRKHIKITNQANSNSGGTPSIISTAIRPNIEQVMYPEHKEEHSGKEDHKKKKDFDGGFAIRLGGRSLKALEVDDDEHSEVEKDSDSAEGMHTIINGENEFDTNTNKEKAINKREAISRGSNISNENQNKSLQDNINDANSGMDLSNFFMMLSNFFSFLDGSDTSNRTGNSSVMTTDPVLKSPYNNDSEETRIDTVYPIYDSDMIENIGHRSRVLLFVNDKSEGVSNYYPLGKSEMEGVQSIGGNSTETLDEKTEPAKALISTTLTVPKIDSDKPTANKLHSKETAKNAVEKNSNILKNNKTVVKRNAEDSSLIFWNDMYDDEYGIKSDPLENAIRDKHSVNTNNFIKKSGTWLHDKFSKIAKMTDSWRSKNNEAKTRCSRDTRNYGLETSPGGKFIDKFLNKFHKREKGGRVKEDEELIDKKQGFDVLTANMKEICRKAAEAVHQTKNIEVREDQKDSHVATTLMQQLVRLMSELVDYQVQQKTCTKLPRDLQNFLEWLTYPSLDSPAVSESHDPRVKNEDISADLDLDVNEDKWSEPIQEPAPLSSSDDLLQTEGRPSRQDCLTSVQALQELVRQYDELTEDDKSKMSGIKPYLDSQLDYLQRQFSIVEEYNMNDTEDILRFRRDLSKRRNVREMGQRKKRKLRHKPGLNRFFKVCDRKRTRTTTASYSDAVHVAGETTQKLKNKHTHDPKTVKTSEKNKRNLKDIYYKAIEDAKKITTIKKLHKKTVLDDTSTVN